MTEHCLALDGMRILVVEDHYFIAVELSEMLQKRGATVVGPVAALPLDPALETQPVDLALLNVDLRGESILSLADDMARRGVPFALVTGYGPQSLPIRYRNFPILDKPVQAEKLTAALVDLATHGRVVSA